MSSLLVDSTPFMAYVDRRELLRSLLPENEFSERRQVYLNHSTTVYVGNLSFYTSEQQLIEHFRPCGAVRDILMGLSETSRTPCGFCFVVFEAQAAAAMAVQVLHGTLLDDRVISVSWDVGCDESRRWGRGAHGGQVVDGIRQNLDEGRGGLGALRRDALGVEVSLAEQEIVEYTWITPKEVKRRLPAAAGAKRVRNFLPLTAQITGGLPLVLYMLFSSPLLGFLRECYLCVHLYSLPKAKGKMLFFPILVATILVGVVLGSLAWGIFTRRLGPPLQPRGSGSPVKVGVVLGSGGHTSEMMRVLKALPHPHWENSEPFYVVSNTDRHSAQLAQNFEQNTFKRGGVLYVIPRAREVSQSYFTAVWTTLLALWSSLMVVYREKPEVLLTNGPGVCLPVILAGFLLPTCCPWYGRRRPLIVYLESFTCVEHLSLTGKLLAPFLADIFTVHWEAARVATSRVRWRGQLYCIGSRTKANDEAGKAARRRIDARQVAPPRDPALAGNYALVTVGSTRFDELIRAMSGPAACRTLRVRFAVDRLLLQYGAMHFAPPPGQPMRRYDDPANAPGAGVWKGICEGVVVEAFAYRSKLEQCIADASLVITHAGAGTILECLNAQCPTVVVPNRQLMSDHQLELANALMRGGYLYCVSVHQLWNQLQTLELDKLLVYPGIDENLLIEVLTSPSVYNKKKLERIQNQIIGNSIE